MVEQNDISTEFLENCSISSRAIKNKWAHTNAEPFSSETDKKIKFTIN